LSVFRGASLRVRGVALLPLDELEVLSPRDFLIAVLAFTVSATRVFLGVESLGVKGTVDRKEQREKRGKRRRWDG
jgi:hypothetical protein